MEALGQPLASGTAFVLTDLGGTEWLITNRHNLAGRRSDTNELMSPKTGAVPDSVRIVHNARQLGSWTERIQPLYDKDKRPLWQEHPALGRTVDVVALPLMYDHTVALHPYTLADPGPDIALSTTTEVWVVGFPFGLTSGGFLALWTRGNVASELQIDFNEWPCFVIDARTRQGQSGSPVIYYSTSGLQQMAGGGAVLSAGGGPTQRLLGVYSGRLNEESDLGLVWRLDAVREVIEGGVRPESN
jgi:hypothetical protein